MTGGRGLTKGGPDGRYRRARPEGRGDPEDAGRVLRQGPSQSVAGGPKGHCGRLGPQSETATRRAGRMDPWVVRRVASLRVGPEPRSGSLLLVDVVAVNLRCRRGRMPWVEKGTGGGSGWISSRGPAHDHVPADRVRAAVSRAVAAEVAEVADPRTWRPKDRRPIGAWPPEDESPVVRRIGRLLTSPLRSPNCTGTGSRLRNAPLRGGMEQVRPDADPRQQSIRSGLVPPGNLVGSLEP